MREKHMYPQADKQFEDTTIKSVEKNGDGWLITRAEGWGFCVPGSSPIEPAVGMKARFYGRGIGSTVRGLFLDGVEVFYRTEAEDNEHSEIQLYGKDAVDWLKRWDEGRSVWSIEMGGMGPGYEQCIQITAAEVLRTMLENRYDASLWEDKEIWKINREEIEQMSFKNPVIKELGLSGAQWGAAVNLAAHLYKKGPREVMKDSRVKNRKIQVSKNFPGCKDADIEATARARFQTEE